MANMKVLSKEHVISEGKAVITETVAKEITRQELLQELRGYDLQQAQIRGQMEQLVIKFNELEEYKTQVNNILKDFPTELPEIK